MYIYEQQQCILRFLPCIFLWKASFECKVWSDMKYGPDCLHQNASSPADVEHVRFVIEPIRKNFLSLALGLDSKKCLGISLKAFCANCVQEDG